MWDKVSAGDPVVHSARRENAISDILNAFQGMSARLSKGHPSANVAVTAVSPEEDIAPFVPVKLLSANPDLVCRISSKVDPESLWGITSAYMPKGIAETVVLRGLTPAVVNISDVTHKFAVLQNGTLESTEIATSCRILIAPEKTGSQLTIILLDPGLPQPEIETSFRVTMTKEKTLSISGGQINRNGTFLTVPPKEGISLQAGTLCIQSRIEQDPEGKNGETKWTTPEYIYASPAPDSWPIADIEEEKDAENGEIKYTIRQRITNIAILMVSKSCPLIRKGSE